MQGLLKCYKCGDDMTFGEQQVYYEYKERRGEKPTCYHCSQEIIAQKVKEWEAKQEKKVTDFMDKVENQHYKWGEPNK